MPPGEIGPLQQHLRGIDKGRVPPRLLLVLPFALPELLVASGGSLALAPQAAWLAGVTGLGLGAIVGLGLYRTGAEE